MRFPVYDNFPTFLIPIILVAFFGIIVGIVILLKRKVKFFKSDEKPKSDKEIAKEELDRLLQPIEDEATEEAVASYKEEEKK